MYSLNDNAFFFISGHGRGWAFSANDLLKKFSRQQADNILSDLVKGGVRYVEYVEVSMIILNTVNF